MFDVRIALTLVLVPACAAPPEPEAPPLAGPGPDAPSSHEARPLPGYLRDSASLGAQALAPAHRSPMAVASPDSHPTLRPLGQNAFASREVPSRTPSLRQSLDQTRVRLQLEDVESLKEVARLLGLQSGLPLLVTSQAEDAVLSEGVLFDLQLPHPLPVRQALDLIADLAGPEIGWTLRHGVVLFTTEEKLLASEVVLRTYDVRPLTAGIQDFHAPDIGRLAVSGFDREDPPEPERVRRFEEEDVLRLVEDHVAPGTWGEGSTSLSLENGTLFVRHRPAVQLQVLALLAALGG